MNRPARARHALAATIAPADLAAARVVTALDRLMTARNVVHAPWTTPLTDRAALDLLAASGVLPDACLAALSPDHPAAAQDAAVHAWTIADKGAKALAGRRLYLADTLAYVDATIDAMADLADALTTARTPDPELSLPSPDLSVIGPTVAAQAAAILAERVHPDPPPVPHLDALGDAGLRDPRHSPACLVCATHGHTEHPPAHDTRRAAMDARSARVKDRAAQADPTLPPELAALMHAARCKVCGTVHDRETTPCHD